METTRERNASRAVQRASIWWPRGVPMVAWEERRRGGVVHVSRCTHNYLSSRIKTTEPSHCLGHLIHRAQLSTATLGRCCCTSFSCLLRLVILLRVLEIKGTPTEIIIIIIIIKYKKNRRRRKETLKRVVEPRTRIPYVHKVPVTCKSPYVYCTPMFPCNAQI